MCSEKVKLLGCVALYEAVEICKTSATPCSSCLLPTFDTGVRPYRLQGRDNLVEVKAHVQNSVNPSQAAACPCVHSKMPTGLEFEGMHGFAGCIIVGDFNDSYFTFHHSDPGSALQRHIVQPPVERASALIGGWHPMGELDCAKGG